MGLKLQLGDAQCLPVSGGDTEEEAVILLKDLGVAEGLDVSRLCGSVHLGEDLLGEGLLDLEEVGITASLFDSSKLSLS